MAEKQILEGSDQALAEVVIGLRDLTEAHGAEAVELTGRVLQMGAVHSLLIVMLLLCVVTACWFVIWRLADKHVIGKSRRSIAEGFWAPALCFGGVCNLFLTVIIIDSVFETLLNPVVWMAATDPKVAIAVHALERL